MHTNVARLIVHFSTLLLFKSQDLTNNCVSNIWQTKAFIFIYFPCKTCLRGIKIVYFKNIWDGTVNFLKLKLK